MLAEKILHLKAKTKNCDEMALNGSTWLIFVAKCTASRARSFSRGFGAIRGPKADGARRIIKNEVNGIIRGYVRLIGIRNRDP